MKILLVEDNADLRMAVTELLRGNRHVVVECDSGEVALAMLRKVPFDVLLTDVGLPGMSGVVFAAEARAANPDVAVVFMTGMASIPGGSAGDPFMLRKPFDAADLEAVLSAAHRSTRKPGPGSGSAPGSGTLM